jgi:hypothetical protein
MLLAATLSSCGPNATQQPGEVKWSAPSNPVDPIDYDEVFHLDAENLAEYGMKQSYDLLIPKLQTLGVKPKPMTEIFSQDDGRYNLYVGGKTYKVWNGEALTKNEFPWPLATAIFFETINDQLSKSEYKFYAINGDNDLHGVFLKKAEFEAAVQFHGVPYDRPYLPNREPPFFGLPQ